MSTRLVVERKGGGMVWEEFAYPRNNMDEAIETLNYFREKEQKKRYKGKLRLVRKTVEIIEGDK